MLIFSVNKWLKIWKRFLKREKIIISKWTMKRRLLRIFQEAKNGLRQHSIDWSKYVVLPSTWLILKTICSCIQYFTRLKTVIHFSKIIKQARRYWTTWLELLKIFISPFKVQNGYLMSINYSKSQPVTRIYLKFCICTIKPRN